MAKFKCTVDVGKEQAIGGLVGLATTGLASELSWHFTAIKSAYADKEAKQRARGFIRTKLQYLIELHKGVGYGPMSTKINVRQAVRLGMIKAGYNA